MELKNCNSILSRTLQMGESSVEVIVYLPEKSVDKDSCYCDFEILGIEGNKRRRAHGGDQIQALILTFERIGIIIDSYNKANTKKMEWAGFEGGGFIFPKGYTDKWLDINNLQIAADVAIAIKNMMIDLERIGNTIRDTCSEKEVESYEGVVNQLLSYINRNILREINRKFPSLQ